MSEAAKRDAYLAGLKLKNTSLDEETIGIRLEKQGIPPELAKEVAKNIVVQRQIDAVNNQQPPGFFSSKEPAFRQLILEIKLWLQIKKQDKK